MITDRDIAVRAGARQVARHQDTRVLSKEVLYCFEDQELEEVARKMRDAQVRRLPVVNRDKRLVGVIPLGDLARNQGARTAGRTVSSISRRGGKHSQSAP